MMVCLIKKFAGALLFIALGVAIMVFMIGGHI